MESLNSRIPVPRERPISGRRLAPNTSSTTPRSISSFVGLSSPVNTLAPCRCRRSAESNDEQQRRHDQARRQRTPDGNEDPAPEDRREEDPKSAGGQGDQGDAGTDPEKNSLGLVGLGRVAGVPIEFPYLRFEHHSLTLFHDARGVRSALTCFNAALTLFNAALLVYSVRRRRRWQR